MLDEVVHQNGHLVLHVTDQHHAIHLVGSLALLVDQSEVNVQAVSDRGHPEEGGRDQGLGLRLGGRTERKDNTFLYFLALQRFG